MGVETATYIPQLNAEAPDGDVDNVNEGDNHLRLIKAVLQAQLGSLGNAALTVTAAQVNSLGNISGNVQTLLDGKAPLASPALTGTPTAPTATAGTSTAQLATTAFVTATSFQTALPGQTGNAGKFVTTDGATAGWGGLYDSPLALAQIQATALLF